MRRHELEMPPPDQDGQDGTCAALLSMANGDWRCRRVQHFCHLKGCCKGHDRGVAVDKMTGILYACFFERLGTKLPSVSRWHTMGPTLSLQAGGLLCHDIITRVLVLAVTEGRVCYTQVCSHARRVA